MLKFCKFKALPPLSLITIYDPDTSLLLEFSVIPISTDYLKYHTHNN